MVRILVIGGGGMVGGKLAERLAVTGLNGRLPQQLVLLDLSYPKTGTAYGDRRIGDLTVSGISESLAAERFDVIFHLAAIVSGEAEQDFSKGWQVNLMSVWHFLEALRREHEASSGSYRPRLVFASTTGVYGPPIDGPVDDARICEPRSSYGAQKVCAEMLIGDFSRKGFVDGVSLRLPTICVRPGRANAAASSFFSNIIREPLNGSEAVLPVARDFRHMHASPRSAAGFFTHAAELDTVRLEGRRALNMPSLTCSVGEQIEALREIAGTETVKLIREQPDPFVESIVSSWPREFAAERAEALGFTAEKDFREIINIYIEDELHVTPAPG
ncbi:MAG: NAD-dependent epimerase/dehydratase family protein [Rhodobacteraceae bacterium]|nr:NAD-dependent epimerase/dehydratase family protein [Paracoccaceae bacterium]